MKSTSAIKPLSEAISGPIIKAYRAGGFGLVFVFIGTLLLLVALFFGGGLIGDVIGILGCLMILTVLYLFYFQSIKPLKDINERIQRNQELIDTVQETAIQMTDLAYDLQALAFKHADEVAHLITQSRQTLQMLSNVPGIGKLADNKYVVKAEDLSASIVKTTGSAKSTIEDIKTALVESNPALLKKYLKQVEELDLMTKELLKKD